MSVPKTNLVSCGDRAFSKVAPHMWNLLPNDVKNATSVDCFKVQWCMSSMTYSLKHLCYK